MTKEADTRWPRTQLVFRPRLSQLSKFNRGATYREVAIANVQLSECNDTSAVVSLAATAISDTTSITISTDRITSQQY